MNVITDSVTVVGSTFNKQLQDFLDFLVKNNIIQLGAAFIIGTQINGLANAFIEHIVSPIVVAVSSDEQAKKLSQTYVEIFGVRFEIGQFIMVLFKFLIMMAVLYYMFKIIGFDNLVVKKK